MIEDVQAKNAGKTFGRKAPIAAALDAGSGSPGVRLLAGVVSGRKALQHNLASR